MNSQQIHTQTDVNNTVDVQLTSILMGHTWACSDLKGSPSGCDLIRVLENSAKLGKEVNITLTLGVCSDFHSAKASIV